jgi:DNA-directed RNA polymerase subunit RPC12/RpoP
VAESPVTLPPETGGAHAQPQFVPSPLKIIERRPRCQNCGARMLMTGVEPMGLGTDRRTFECDQCGLEEELLVKF